MYLGCVLRRFSPKYSSALKNCELRSTVDYDFKSGKLNSESLRAYWDFFVVSTSALNADSLYGAN
jgi:hypothetical protein